MWWFVGNIKGKERGTPFGIYFIKNISTKVNDKKFGNKMGSNLFGHSKLLLCFEGGVLKMLSWVQCDCFHLLQALTIWCDTIFLM
jgi:hypothetical protein